MDNLDASRTRHAECTDWGERFYLAECINYHRVRPGAQELVNDRVVLNDVTGGSVAGTLGCEFFLTCRSFVDYMTNVTAHNR